MEKTLNILMISSDRNIAVPGSFAAERMKDYGTLVGALHIVLLCDGKHTRDLKIENGELKIAEGVFVYPTNSSFNLLRPLDAARIGKRLVREKGFVRGRSLITAQDPFECGWAAREVKKRWRLPLEVQLHTDPFSPYFTGFQNMVRKSFTRGVLASADAVRVVSDELGARVAPLAKAPVFVLPIYVDKERVESAPISFDLHARYPWRFILLAASRLTPEKDLSTALEALAIARRATSDIGLVIAGEGPERGRLEAEAKKLGLAGAVEFAGWQGDLASYYKTANAFIQTSLFEGYGLSLVEAGLSGLPVVTTPVGLAAGLEAGLEVLIVPPRRPDLAAAAILDLLEHNGKRESLREGLRRALEAKLLSKEEYLGRLKEAWLAASRRIA